MKIEIKYRLKIDEVDERWFISMKGSLPKYMAGNTSFHLGGFLLGRNIFLLGNHCLVSNHIVTKIVETKLASS